MASNDFLFFLSECDRKSIRWQQVHNRTFYDPCPECGRHTIHEPGCPMEMWIDRIVPIPDQQIEDALVQSEIIESSILSDEADIVAEEFAKAEWHIDCHVCGVPIAYCHCDEIFRDDPDVLGSIRADHKLAITDWNNKLIGK